MQNLTKISPKCQSNPSITSPKSHHHHHQSRKETEIIIKNWFELVEVNKFNKKRNFQQKIIASYGLFNEQRQYPMDLTPHWLLSHISAKTYKFIPKLKHNQVIIIFFCVHLHKFFFSLFLLVAAINLVLILSCFLSHIFINLQHTSNIKKIFIFFSYHSCLPCI